MHGLKVCARVYNNNSVDNTVYNMWPVSQTVLLNDKTNLRHIRDSWFLYSCQADPNLLVHCGEVWGCRLCTVRQCV